MFTIDGIRWPWPCDIARAAEVKGSEISGLMLDKRYFNDVLGTYMAYTVDVAVPAGGGEKYEQLYETLTRPVDGHSFIFPYNRGELCLTGRVDGVSDICVRLPGGGMHWKGVRFTVMANHPSRQVTLGEALALGRVPVPNIAGPEEGDSYTYTGGAWVRAAVYADADERGY